MNTDIQRNTAFQVVQPNADNIVQFGSKVASRSQWVRIPQNQSFWCQYLAGRFNELVALPLGWDGYAGVPVSFTCAKFAFSFLNRLCQDGISPPSLVPGSDGTLQIEWHENQYDLEIDVLDAYNIVATRYDHRTDKEEVLELQSDFSPIVEWINSLASNHEAVQQETA